MDKPSKKWTSSNRAQRLSTQNQSRNINKRSIDPKDQTGESKAHSAMTRLATLWKNKAITPQRSNATSHLSCQCCCKYGYDGCESWTFTAAMEARIEAFSYKCFRRMVGISCREISEVSCNVWQQVILARRQDASTFTLYTAY